MNDMKNHNLARRLVYAFSGIHAAFKTEKSFRFHIVALIVVVGLLVITRPEPIWWALLLLAAGLVLTAEMINTAIERLVDHLHPEMHPNLKVVKDTLAGAVLVLSVVSVVMLAIFIVHLASGD